MRTIQIPETELKVSVLSFGAGGIGAAIDEQTSFRMLDRYMELGGNMIDTARIYSDWIPGEKSRSERMIGQWLNNSPLAKSAIIATKGGHPEIGSDQMRLSKPEIVYDLEQSLRLLGLDCIEMYWLHRDDRSRPVGEILETLNEQVKAGSIRYFGCSNWQLDRIQEASDYARQHGLKSFAGSQVSWSLAVKNSGSEPDPTLVTMDAKSQQYHQSSQLSAWAYSSQANGLFAKLAGSGPDSLKTGVKRKYLNPVTMRRYELAKEIAELMSVSITAVILAYLTSQPFPVVSIIGCKTMEQLEESMEAGDVVLPPETIREFERITADYE